MWYELILQIFQVKTMRKKAQAATKSNRSLMTTWPIWLLRTSKHQARIKLPLKSKGGWRRTSKRRWFGCSRSTRHNWRRWSLILRSFRRIKLRENRPWKLLKRRRKRKVRRRKGCLKSRGSGRKRWRKKPTSRVLLARRKSDLYVYKNVLFSFTS